jgi:hypothetical protein
MTSNKVAHCADKRALDNVGGWQRLVRQIAIANGNFYSPWQLSSGPVATTVNRALFRADAGLFGGATRPADQLTLIRLSRLSGYS